MSRVVKSESENQNAAAKRRYTKNSASPYPSEDEQRQILSMMKDEFILLKPALQIEFLESVGVGKDFLTCQRCGHVKVADKFYANTKEGYNTRRTNICKDCADDIALPTIDGIKENPTKNTVKDALYELDKPYFDSVWEASVNEAANQFTGKTKNNVWTSYIKNIQMCNYYTLTYRDSDDYSGSTASFTSLIDSMPPKDKEISEQFEKNKKDTLRLLGYLPFENEKEMDQPFLYSQLIGFLDSSEEGNDDMMRVQSIISIVRGFLQISQIDNMIADCVKDPSTAAKNIATVKALQDMKSKLTFGVSKLAEQSCISLKNSKNSIRGENTWTGKIKKIKDMNLREGEVNGFDIATCKGMQQVQEISDASIMKQLALDESEWSDMVAEMRKTIVELRRLCNAYKEVNRLLLRENIDLKDYMNDNHLPVKQNLIDLKQLYSQFASKDSSDEVNSSIEESSDDDEPDEDYSYLIQDDPEDQEENTDDHPFQESDSDDQSESVNISEFSNQSNNLSEANGEVV